MNNKTQSSNPQQHRKPQEPVLPYPYYQEEVAFINAAANVSLSGTLTMPNNHRTFPAIVLIAGYGPYDRDLTGMGHKRFLVLADYLTRQGFAVLRYDKRGVGASTGNYATATTQDFANDACAGVEFLKKNPNIDAHRIGLIGLSEGGLIASIVATQMPEIAFLVLMAPAVVTSVDYLVDQAAAQLRADGASEAFIEGDKKVRAALCKIIKEEKNSTTAEQKALTLLNNYCATLPEDQTREAEKLLFAFTQAKAAMLVKTYNSPWYRFFLAYEPTKILEQIKIPVLVINGDRDWIASPENVFPVVEQALEKAGNKNYSLVVLPNLNHGFQTCKTGAVMEYGTIEETIAPVALQTMSDWIKKVFGVI